MFFCCWWFFVVLLSRVSFSKHEIGILSTCFLVAYPSTVILKRNHHVGPSHISHSYHYRYGFKGVVMMATARFMWFIKVVYFHHLGGNLIWYCSKGLLKPPDQWIFEASVHNKNPIFCVPLCSIRGRNFARRNWAIFIPQGFVVWDWEMLTKQMAPEIRF